MTRLSFVAKKDKVLLRPLTEKEIQQKLYGNYFEESTPKTSPIELVEPLQKAKGSIVPPQTKIRISIPWEQIFRNLLKGIMIGFDFLVSSSKMVWNLFLNKVGFKWGFGILTAICIFVAVSALNEYRTKAMESRTLNPPLATTVKSVSAPSFSEAQRVLFPVGEQTPQPAVAAPPAPPQATPYVVQVCIYARKSDAEKLANQLAQDKLPAFVQSIRRPNAKTFYPVFLGRYSDFRQAQAELEKFRKKPVAKEFPDSFIRTL